MPTFYGHLPADADGWVSRADLPANSPVQPYDLVAAQADAGTQVVGNRDWWWAAWFTAPTPAELAAGGSVPLDDLRVLVHWGDLDGDGWDDYRLLEAADLTAEAAYLGGQLQSVSVIPSDYDPSNPTTLGGVGDVLHSLHFTYIYNSNYASDFGRLAIRESGVGAAVPVAFEFALPGGETASGLIATGPGVYAHGAYSLNLTLTVGGAEYRWGPEDGYVPLGLEDGKYLTGGPIGLYGTIDGPAAGLPLPKVDFRGDHVVVADAPGDPDPFVGGLDAGVVPHAFEFVTAGGAVVAGSLTPPLEPLALGGYDIWSPYPTSYPVFDLEFRVGGQQYTGADVLGYPTAVFHDGEPRGVAFDTGDGFPGGRVRAGVAGGEQFFQVGAQPAAVLGPVKPVAPAQRVVPAAPKPVAIVTFPDGKNRYNYRLEVTVTGPDGDRTLPALTGELHTFTARQAVEQLTRILSDAGIKVANNNRDVLYIYGQNEADGSTGPLKKLVYSFLIPNGGSLPPTLTGHNGAVVSPPG